MKTFNNFEKAVIRNAAKTNYALVAKREKVQEKINALQLECDAINATLEKFEAPIRELTGGKASYELVKRVVTVDGDKKTVKFEFIEPSEDKKYTTAADLVADGVNASPVSEDVENLEDSKAFQEESENDDTTSEVEFDAPSDPVDNSSDFGEDLDPFTE